jgi:cytoskeletal protein RodZ
MPFFKPLRRRSKASFHTSKSNEFKLESPSNGDMTSGKSSSTLETASYSSITPPSSIKPNASSPNLPALTEVNSNVNGTSTPLTVPPQRPGLAPVPPSQRNSMVVRHDCIVYFTQRMLMFVQFGSDCSDRLVVQSQSIADHQLRPLLTLRGLSPSRIMHGYVLCIVTA